MLTTVQEILFDIIDLVDENEELMNTKITGFDEFETLGEFLQEQREKLSEMEDALL